MNPCRAIVIRAPRASLSLTPEPFQRMRNLNAQPDTARGPQQHYLQALAGGTLLLQRCTQCGLHQFPPRALCVHCSATEPGWVIPSGLGTVYSCSVVARRIEDGGDYNVVLVDLDEGVRLMSHVVNWPGISPPIGLRVCAQFESSPDGTRLVFTPVGGLQ